MSHRDDPLRSSGIRYRALPGVMLVRVAEIDEAALGLEDLGAPIYRVRHPIPADERARVTEPVVIVIGEGVRPIDASMLWERAERIGAAVVELTPAMSRSYAAKLVKKLWIDAIGARAASA